MARTAAARFDKGLKEQGLDMDARDRAAALRVFASLERACDLLKTTGQGDDQPR